MIDTSSIKYYILNYVAKPLITTFISNNVLSFSPHIWFTSVAGLKIFPLDTDKIAQHNLNSMVTITLPPNGKVNDFLNYQPDYFQSSLYSITTYITLPLTTQRRLRTAVTSQNLLPWPRGVGCYTLIITNMQKNRFQSCLWENWRNLHPFVHTNW